MNSDKPIIDPSKDKFNRQNFAKRIANVVEYKGQEDSLVLAINGKWGSGKSSVLNLIRYHLDENEIISVLFNPWIFDVEDKLIVKFFKKLAEAIGNSPFSKAEELKNKFKSYGTSLLPIVKSVPYVNGLASNAVEALTNLIDDVTPESHKEKISSLLIEEKKRIVVFIDDIDRLDKTEIYSLMKLVKLTGDLPYISYVLSFDIDVVSKAIGERFGDGSSIYGLDFIEKIVQIPVKLPKIRFVDLQSYTYDEIKSSLNLIGVEISEKDYVRFSSLFDKYVMRKIDSPRKSVQISNVIKFNLPLLKDEVNHVDVILLEAIKIFYPTAYKIISEYPEVFTESNKDFMGTLPRRNHMLKSYDELKIEIYQDCVSGIDKNNLKEFICELFPLYRENTSNYIYGEESKVKYYQDQRIASSKYLNRYLSMSIIQGDISDAEFNRFLKIIPFNEVNKISNLLADILTNYSVNHVVHLLRSKEDIIDLESAEKLCKAIVNNDNKFDQFESIFMSSMGNSTMQSSMFVRKIIERIELGDVKFQLASYVIQDASRIDYVFAFLSVISFGENKNESALPTNELRRLDRVFALRLVQYSKNSIFENYDNRIIRLLLNWKLINDEEYTEYIDSIITEPNAPIDIIKTFTPTVVCPLLIGLSYGYV